MSRPRTRRRFLTATVAVIGGLGLAVTTDADADERSFVVEQDGDCFPVVPLSGEAPVATFYEWGRDSLSWSSEGTRELQRSDTSLLFLYDGPEGLSLVVIHDKADDETPGGTVSFTIEGVPADATWAVKDDLYDAPTNLDTWDINGTVLEANESTITDDYAEPKQNDTDSDDNESELDGNESEDGDTDSDDNESEDGDTDSDDNESEDGDNETLAGTRTDEIDWWWTTGRTDGGALRGLAVDDLELRIEPAFNDEAELADNPNEGELRSWELLSGDVEDPDRSELALDEPLTLRTGSCDDNRSTPTEETGTDEEPASNQEEATDAPEDSEATDGNDTTEENDAEDAE